MSIAIARLSCSQVKQTKLSLKGIRLPLLQENATQLLLIFIALISSLVLIYIKDFNRRLFIQYQNLEYAHIEKVGEQQQLVLEKTTWSTHNRIQLLASEKLGMILPPHEQTIVINAKIRTNRLIHASKQTHEKPA